MSPTNHVFLHVPEHVPGTDDPVRLRAHSVGSGGAAQRPWQRSTVMQQSGPSPSGVLYPLFVLALLMGVLGFGTLTTALHDSGKAQWSAVGFASPATYEGNRQSMASQSRVADSAVGTHLCQPRRLVCAAPIPGTVELPGGGTRRTRSGPGEREIVLHASAAVARGHVWVQEHVATPLSADFEKIASTSPNP